MYEGFPFLLLFGVVFLIFLVEGVDMLLALVRRLRFGGSHLPEMYAGFSLRRPNSEFRARHLHKIRPTGRTTEAIRYPVDPYDIC